MQVESEWGDTFFRGLYIHFHSNFNFHFNFYFPVYFQLSVFMYLQFHFLFCFHFHFSFYWLLELIGWLWVLQSLSKTFSNLRHFKIDGSHPHCSQFGIVFLGYCCYFWKKACNEVNENNQNNHYRFSDQRQAMKTVNSVVKMKVSTWKSICRQLVYSPSSEECGPQCGIVQDLFFKASQKAWLKIDSGWFCKKVWWFGMLLEDR